MFVNTRLRPPILLAEQSLGENALARALETQKGEQSGKILRSRKEVAQVKPRVREGDGGVKDRHWEPELHVDPPEIGGGTTQRELTQNVS